MTRPHRAVQIVELLAWTAVLGACAGSGPPRTTPDPRGDSAPPDRTALATIPPKEPLLSPQFARLAGLMPRRAIGAEAFVASHPTYDGRGVIIGILDSGIDAGVPGLRRTSTGAPKLLDLRDFSGEGVVPLTPLARDTSSTAMIGGIRVTGLGRVRRLAAPPFYAGTFHERPLGEVPGADVNGDGDNTDVFPVVVARASDGWILMTDTDGDGSLADEQAVRDFRVAGETFAYGPLTIAANFHDDGPGDPHLTFFFDNSGHGTHVAGIAAGHDLFGLPGFDGIAPGAQLLGLKISNNARGGVSVTGSMVRAMEYAAEYAAARGLPLVLNLSFGVGNEAEGSAAIDSLIDEFAVRHPDVLFVISATNDGPGISTVGFPGSAEFALTACALFPGVFARPPQPGLRPADDVLGWWSSRGGEVSKPDLCAPGVAFSNVPLWQTGEEVSAGTSMAAPQLSGAAALLLSGLAQVKQQVRATELRRALVATASSIPGTTTIDAGAGIPDVRAAFRWLRAAHRAGRFSVRALPDGGNTSRATAAYRRSGLTSPGDTVQRFEIRAVEGQPFAKVLLRSDAPWLRAPESVEFHGGPVTVELHYDAAQLAQPGLYVGTVWARPATDTMAGAAFGLTNTVIVPRPLDDEFADRRYLAPGRTQRYFLAISPDAGGLGFELSVADREREATLYLFEPSGHPYRETASVSAGGESSSQVELRVRSDDLIAGVYEAVVVAPPLDGVVYSVRATLPTAVIGSVSARGVAITNRSNRVARLDVTLDVIGAASVVRVGGPGDRPHRIPIRVPPWAHEILMDLAIPETLWSRLTDFAVTIWDSTGRVVSQGPINYAISRERFEVGSLRGQTIELELFPAFASADAKLGWEADLEIAFLADGVIARAIPDTVAARQLQPWATEIVPAAMPDSLPHMPAGFLPLLEATLRQEGRLMATRRATMGPVPGTTP